ncbi:MAG TPA: HAD family phosphatase [Ignavibacteria bacterium]|jgi:putative hydrolase of the HAD superfamily
MIKNIIFDLGNVLVDVQYERFRKVICSKNVTEKQYDDFFLNGNYRIMGYESGKINTGEFVSTCINGLNLRMSEQDFSNAFNDMFEEITPMKELVLKLSRDKSHNLFLLSNTSPLHFEHAIKRFDFINSLHSFGLSYELKSLKPEKEIYERAINQFGVNPAECLFIDDLAENCASAEKFGIKTIVYDKKNHEAFVPKFEKLIH